MGERGVHVQHAPMHRGGIHDSPPREAALHRRTRPVGRRWHLAETDSRVHGEWRDLARAGEQHGQTSALRRMAHRAQEAA
jgi:putative transposase